MFRPLDFSNRCERPFVRTGVRALAACCSRRAPFQARLGFACRRVRRACDRAGYTALGATRAKFIGMCFAFASSALCRRSTAPAVQNKKCGTRNHTLSCAESMAKPSRPTFILTSVVCTLRMRAAFAMRCGRCIRGGLSAHSCSKRVSRFTRRCVHRSMRAWPRCKRAHCSAEQPDSRSALSSVLSVTFVQYGERLNELCEVSYGSCRA